MTLTATIDRRDFSASQIMPASLAARRLSWSAFGGPDQATLTAICDPLRLYRFLDFLRCPVMITDPNDVKVWWGYVNTITIYLNDLQITVTLDTLFNKVKVIYSTISPDNKIQIYEETASVGDASSEAIYGTKETVLNRLQYDPSKATALRNTFLNQRRWPHSVLSGRTKYEDHNVEITCKGWFHTLSWQNYTHSGGFRANYGPGPGVFAFADHSDRTYIAQLFNAGNNTGALHYAYFLMLRVGTAPSVTCQLWSDASYSPSGLLASATTITPSVGTRNFSWVQFTFPTPHTLANNTRYWIVLRANAISATNHFRVKTNEDMNFEGYFWGISGTSVPAWSIIPSITAPGTWPSFYYRVVCLRDSGDILSAIATAAGQFFPSIHSLSTGSLISPYFYGENSGLKEILSVMHYGTSSQRLILARVHSNRTLEFYSQPEPAIPEYYINAKGEYFSKFYKKLLPYQPPVGQYVVFSGSDRIQLPWYNPTLPAAFVYGAEYHHDTRKLISNLG